MPSSVRRRCSAAFLLLILDMTVAGLVKGCYWVKLDGELNPGMEERPVYEVTEATQSLDHAAMRQFRGVVATGP